MTRCVVPDHLCGIDGIVHGGIVVLLLDEIAQWAMLARLGRMGVTSEIDVRYLRPVPTGVELTVEGRIGSHDDKRVRVHSGVRAADGTVLAEADSQWRLASPAAMSRLGKVDPAELQQFLSHYPVAYRG